MDRIKFVKQKNGGNFEDDPNLSSRPFSRRLSARVRTIRNRTFRCGFYFYRNFLIGLNVLYLLISISLLMLVIVAKALMYLDSIPVLGGVAAAAAILFLIAIIGLLAIIKQNQIILFFFMITLGFTSVLCFCLSMACMALPAHGQHQLLLGMWDSMAGSGQSHIQKTLDCCGFSNRSRYHPPCHSSDNTGPECCEDGNSTRAYVLPSNLNRAVVYSYYTESCPSCQLCYPLWEHAIASALYTAGMIGLIFSFSQTLGIFMVYRYRHLRNPAVNPYRNFL